MLTPRSSSVNTNTLEYVKAMSAQPEFKPTRFAIIPENVIELSATLTYLAFRVYAALRLLCDFESGRCRASKKEIAKKLGTSERSVYRALCELERHNLIRRPRRGVVKLGELSESEHDAPVMTHPSPEQLHRDAPVMSDDRDMTHPSCRHDAPVRVYHYIKDLSEEDQSIDRSSQLGKGEGVSDPCLPRPDDRPQRIFDAWNRMAETRDDVFGEKRMGHALASRLSSRLEAWPDEEEWLEAIELVSKVRPQTLDTIKLRSIWDALRYPKNTEGPDDFLLTRVHAGRYRSYSKPRTESEKTEEEKREARFERFPEARFWHVEPDPDVDPFSIPPQKVGGAEWFNEQCRLHDEYEAEQARLSAMGEES